jgi:hypothetical protein
VDVSEQGDWLSGAEPDADKVKLLSNHIWQKVEDELVAS